MATKTTSDAGEERFSRDIADLADALRALARRAGVSDDDHTDGDDGERRRLLQRVDFGYRALGTLMGRVNRGSATQFDVPVFAARRAKKGDEIVLPGLPDDVCFIELRSGQRSETVRVLRPDDDNVEGRRRGSRSKDPRIDPKVVKRRHPIPSVLGLRHRRGPVVALGPRIAADASATGSTPG